MEILSALLLILVAILFILYVLLTEGVDWIGRAELIEKRWPGLWAAMNNRPMRLVLVVVAIVMIYHVMQDLSSGAEPPSAVFKAPTVPAIDTNVKVISVAKKEPNRMWSTLQFVDQKAGKYTTYVLVFANFRIEPIRFYVGGRQTDH